MAFWSVPDFLNMQGDARQGEPGTSGHDFDLSDKQFHQFPMTIQLYPKMWSVPDFSQ